MSLKLTYDETKYAPFYIGGPKQPQVPTHLHESQFIPNQVYWEMKDGIRLVKGIVVGTKAVRLFKGHGFNSEYRPTNGIEFTAKDYLADLRFQIWDTSGEDKAFKITTPYYKGVHIFIIVFDVTDRLSFEAVNKIDKVIQEDGKPYRSVILIGNMTDLPNREVNYEEATAYAAKKGYRYYDVSCKTDNPEKVKQIFDEVFSEHTKITLPLNNFSAENFSRNLGHPAHSTLNIKVTPKIL